MIDPNYILQVGASTDAYIEQLQSRIAELQEQLAASQAQEEKLREALDELVDLVQDIRAETYKPDSFTCQPALKALSTPSDTTALEHERQRVAEKIAAWCEEVKGKSRDARFRSAAAIIAGGIRAGDWRKYLEGGAA